MYYFDSLPAFILVSSRAIAPSSLKRGRRCSWNVQGTHEIFCPYIEDYAQVALQRAELKREHLVEKMLLELSRAWDMLDEARLEEELSVQSLDQADENRMLCRKQYEAGMESLSDYLEAELLWRQAFAAQVESRCQMYLAYVQFLKSSGQME